MDAKQFGAFLSQVRKEREMTQAELAEQLQVTDKAVSRWERGVGLPDITMLEPLSQALNVTVLELLRSEHLGSSPLSSQETEQTVLDAVQAAADQQRSLQNRWSTILAGAVCAALIPAAALLIGASEFPYRGFFQFLLPLCALCAVEYALSHRNKTISWILPLVTAFSAVVFGWYALIIAAALLVELLVIYHGELPVRQKDSHKEEGQI